MIIAVCVSARKGTQKQPVEAAYARAGHGIVGDAHAGPGTRQISLLHVADVHRMRARGVRVGPGAFGENIVVADAVLTAVRAGDLLRITGGPLLYVTQRGKKCHNDGCVIRRRAGFCIMPARGVFATVLRGGVLRPGQGLRLVRARRGANSAHAARRRGTAV